MRVETGGFGRLIEQLSESTGGQSSPLAMRGKQPGVILAPLGQKGATHLNVRLYGRARGLVQGRQAFFSTLSLLL